MSSNHPTDHLLHPLLQEHRIQLRLLQPQWTSVLQSDVRIKSAISNAAETADRILGIQPSPTLDWVPTVIAHVTDADISPSPEVNERVEDSEGVMVEDELEDEMEGLMDSESMDEDATAELVWSLPVRVYPHVSLHKLMFFYLD